MIALQHHLRQVRSSSSTTSAIYYYANVLIDNPDRTLRIGMTTENNIKIANAKDVLLVSNMAIQKRDGKSFVNVLNDKNQPEPREVEIGVQNDFKTEIKSGLNEGEKVIVSQVANGEKVGSMPRGPKNVLKCGRKLMNIIEIELSTVTSVKAKIAFIF